MKEKVGEFFATVIPIVLFIGFFVGIPVGTSIYNANKTTCSTAIVPYTSSHEYDPTAYTWTNNYVRVSGQNGEKEVCKKGETVVSETIIKEPVNELRITGTKQLPAYQPTYRVGAICGDGTRSYATGRGACSWHGGVSRWLYGE